ncbi:hypothetical protein M747DRAFT_242514 [Aspergillus niger ATCC 13496]|uniref:Uncharacterized protein n=3 Tax=Aspergillus niger TaxID=5061 RepID=A2Q9X8_ASPNC|nr:hypothetical protein An01g09470 [Aspergillus niger]RDH17683.1 hypothetical protein M747DRAFT_242514 [Aspergillus niger ATCC 13496]CAK43997.1 hypothetical protein An01g09470 [Aspergillus niger]
MHAVTDSSAPSLVGSDSTSARLTYYTYQSFICHITVSVEGDPLASLPNLRQEWFRWFKTVGSIPGCGGRRCLGRLWDLGTPAEVQPAPRKKVLYVEEIESRRFSTTRILGATKLSWADSSRRRLIDRQWEVRLMTTPRSGTMFNRKQPATFCRPFYRSARVEEDAGSSPPITYPQPMEGILEVGMEHSLHMPNKLIIRFHHHARPGSGCPKFSILWGVYRGFVYAAMAVGFRALACTGKARPRTPSTYVRIPKIVRMNRQRIKNIVVEIETINTTTPSIHRAKGRSPALPGIHYTDTYAHTHLTLFSACPDTYSGKSSRLFPMIAQIRICRVADHLTKTVLVI